MTLHARLVAAVTVLSVVLLGVALTIVWLAVRASQEEQFDVDLRGEAIEEAHDAAARGGRGVVLAERQGSPGDETSIAKYGVIYGADGIPVAWTPNLGGHLPSLVAIKTPRGTCFDLYVAREHARAILVDIPRRSGATLLLGASRADLDNDLAYLGRALAFAFAAVVVLTGVIAARLVRRFTRDYEAIAEVTRRAAEGDLAARVAPMSSGREVGRLRTNINMMIARLESLLCSHQTFVAHAAHELRSPLTTLYGELSLDLRRTRSGDEYRLAIQRAIDDTRRLSSLADDLLALARLDAGSDEPWQLVALTDVVAKAERAVSAELRARQIQLELQIIDRPVFTRGTELERMVRNLLENAVKHSPLRGYVTVRAYQSDAELFIEVGDAGPGIQEADRARIFEPFWRGPGQRATEASGAGLGLAIARRIARAHGGDIEIDKESTLGGALFRIALPLSLSESENLAPLDTGSRRAS